MWEVSILGKCPLHDTNRPHMPHFFIRVVFFLALGSLIYMACSRYFVEAVPIGMLFWGVGCCMHFSPDLVNLIPAISRAARHSALEKWNGRYYTFNDSQIRLCLIEGTVWIVEVDVRQFMSPAVSEREQRMLGSDYARIPGTNLRGYSEQGLLRLIQVRLARRGGETSMKKFIVWLQKEAIPNINRFPTSSTT